MLIILTLFLMGLSLSQQASTSNFQVANQPSSSAQNCRNELLNNPANEVNKCCVGLIDNYTYKNQLLSEKYNGNRDAAVAACTSEMCFDFGKYNLPTTDPTFITVCAEAKKYVHNPKDILHLAYSSYAKYVNPPLYSYNRMVIAQGLVANQPIKYNSNIPDIIQPSIEKRSFSYLYSLWQNYNFWSTNTQAAVLQPVISKGLGAQEIYTLLWCPEVFTYYQSYIQLAGANVHCPFSYILWIIRAYCQKLHPQNVTIGMNEFLTLTTAVCGSLIDDDKVKAAISIVIQSALNNQLDETHMVLAFSRMSAHDYFIKLNYENEENWSLDTALMLYKTTCHAQVNGAIVLVNDCLFKWISISENLKDVNFNARFLKQDFQSAQNLAFAPILYVNSLEGITNSIVHLSPLCNIPKLYIFLFFYIYKWRTTVGPSTLSADFMTYSLKFSDEHNCAAIANHITNAVVNYTKDCKIENRHVYECVQIANNGWTQYQNFLNGLH